MKKKYKDSSLPADQYQQIMQRYTLRESTEVLQFFERHPLLLPLFIEIHKKLEIYFSNSQFFLKNVIDPEIFDEDLDIIDSSENMVVFIATHLAPNEAVKRLSNFYRSWWLEASRQVEEKVSFNLECL